MTQHKKKHRRKPVPIRLRRLLAQADQLIAKCEGMIMEMKRKEPPTDSK